MYNGTCIVSNARLGFFFNLTTHSIVISSDVEIEINTSL